jgi:hypothetical protein
MKLVSPNIDLSLFENASSVTFNKRYNEVFCLLGYNAV